VTYCTESHPPFWVIKFQSVSAFAPIVNPINCPWGQKAFSNYLGLTKEDWEVLFSLDIIELSLICHLLISVCLQEYDATCLIRKSKGVSTPILIDQVCGNGLTHALFIASRYSSITMLFILLIVQNMEVITGCSDKFATFLSRVATSIQVNKFNCQHVCIMGLLVINAFILYAIILVNTNSYLSKFRSCGRKWIERSI
jgi:hypothetical protein